MQTDIKVKITPHSDMLGEGLWVVVSLGSHRKPNLFSHNQCAVYKHEPFERVRVVVGAAGGALAEYQNKEFGDAHDPSECAKIALEVYDRMISDFNQTGQMGEGRLLN